MAIIRFFIFALVACVLVGCGGSTMAPVVNAWHQPSAANSAYLVRRGDTLYSIAWAFGLDYRSLAQANGLKPPYTIDVGQRLRMTTGVSRQSKRQMPTASNSKPVLKPRVKPKAKQRIPRHVAFNGAWRWPTTGRLVRKYNPKSGGNNGIDIAGRLGQSIKAAASGVVVYSGTGVRGYGHLIIIKHNSSYLSAYAYNMRNLVKVGMRVQRGQTIATMGKDNGGKTMLHFEIRKDGRPVNPLNYLR
ncbi:MAG: peptidoglycan DD-metalloendopeptidase family protein [Coxiellaceae bacterium]|nr:peptidoglycan DD-metalloendopeptidase family protein [Coxiellaceae bacterium]